MSVNDFPDVGFHRAAAALHQELATHPHPSEVDSYLDAGPASAVEAGSEEHAELRRRVLTLVRGAADVSEWAVELGAANLTPFHTHAWRTAAGEDFAVQLAAGEELKPAFRRVLTRAVHDAVEGVYEEYLNQVPKTHIPAAVR
jgi:hypothetical protein